MLLRKICAVIFLVLLSSLALSQANTSRYLINLVEYNGKYYAVDKSVISPTQVIEYDAELNFIRHIATPRPISNLNATSSALFASNHGYILKFDGSDFTEVFAPPALPGNEQFSGQGVANSKNNLWMVAKNRHEKYITYTLNAQGELVYTSPKFTPETQQNRFAYLGGHFRRLFHQPQAGELHFNSHQNGPYKLIIENNGNIVTRPTQSQLTGEIISLSANRNSAFTTTGKQISFFEEYFADRFRSTEKFRQINDLSNWFVVWRTQGNDNICELHSFTFANIHTCPSEITQHTPILAKNNRLFIGTTNTPVVFDLPSIESIDLPQSAEDASQYNTWAQEQIAVNKSATWAIGYNFGQNALIMQSPTSDEILQYSRANGVVADIKIGGEQIYIAYQNGLIETKAGLAGQQQKLVQLDKQIKAIAPTPHGLVVATNNQIYLVTPQKEIIATELYNQFGTELHYSASSDQLFASVHRFAHSNGSQIASFSITDTGLITTSKYSAPWHHAIEPFALADQGTTLAIRAGIINGDSLTFGSLLDSADTHLAWQDGYLIGEGYKGIRIFDTNTASYLAPVLSLGSTTSITGIYPTQAGTVFSYNTATGTAFSLLQLTGDTDKDGIPHAQDNCPNIANPAQANLDADAQGDACDTDQDGDGIADTTETLHGLDPRNSNDGSEDQDGDGHSNKFEYLHGSNLSDAASAPAKLSTLTIDLANPQTHPNGLSMHNWQAESEGVFTGAVSAALAGATIELKLYLEVGHIGFYVKNNRARPPELALNGNAHAFSVIDLDNKYDWQFYQAQIPEAGEYTIRIVNKQGTSKLSNIVFSPLPLTDLRFDQDKDGVLDWRDNCKWVHNPGQDGDSYSGYGEACEQDTDKDGAYDQLELAKGLNPNDRSDLNTDSDNDGVADSLEVQVNADHLDANSTPRLAQGLWMDYATGDYTTARQAIGYEVLSEGSVLLEDFENEHALMLRHEPATKPLSLLLETLAPAGTLHFEYKILQGESFKIGIANSDNNTQLNKTNNSEWQTASLSFSSPTTTLRLVIEVGDKQTYLPATLALRSIRYEEHDSDHDGVANSLDNCPDRPNQNQTDLDGDNIGDVCDLDKDGDGALDEIEARFGLDSNNPNDGLADFDGDGVSNADEIKSGSDINDASQAIPVYYNAELSDSIPLDQQVAMNEHPWLALEHSLGRILVSDKLAPGQMSTFSMRGYFAKGYKSFYCKLSEDASPAELRVEIGDGSQTPECTSDKWTFIVLPVHEGTSQITVKYAKSDNYLYPEENADLLERAMIYQVRYSQLQPVENMPSNLPTDAQVKEMLREQQRNNANQNTTQDAPKAKKKSGSFGFFSGLCLLGLLVSRKTKTAIQHP